MIHYLLTLLASMAPLVEFRFAIPFGVSLGLPVWQSVLVSIFGAVLITNLILVLLPRVVYFARRKSKWLDRKLQRLFERSRKIHSKKMKGIGVLGMVFFVVLPIPGSGVYTAALLSYLFAWPFWKSWISISIGAFLGSILIGFITASGVGIWKYIESFWL